MFRIDSNQAIRISRGDDVFFPLFLNKGTSKVPIRYAFQPEDAVITTSTHDFNVECDVPTFGQKVGETGTYKLVYVASANEWVMGEAPIDVDEYGLTITGTVVAGDEILIQYEKADGCKVVFYILQINAPWENPILAKEFTPTKENVNDNKDLILSLDREDTVNIPEGEYRYQIKAYLKDEHSSSGYSWNTVTNRLPFVVVNDEYQSNFIYR